MRNLSNGDRHANKARMLRSSRQNLSILFVEGDVDARFYGQFISHNTCSLVNTSGREHALNAGKILDRDGFRGFLVLVDRDDWAVNADPIPAYIVTTDGRDLESTLLRGGIGLRLLAQYGDRSWIQRLEALGKKTIMELIAEWTAVVGVIRWISNSEGRMLTTKNVDLTNFVDWERMTISMNDVATFILRNSGGSGAVPFDVARDELARRSLDLLGTTKDKWVFCSGHDVCNTLMRGLIRKFGNKESEKLTIEVFESSVRACCSPNEFAITQLYKKIREWEQSNVPYQVLSK